MKNKNVLVIGAARTGIAATRLLLNHGFNVTLTDTKSMDAVKDYSQEIAEEIENLKDSYPEVFKLVLGEQINPDSCTEFDLIIPSPGVPETIPVLQKAVEEGIEIISEPELAYRLSSTPFIAITGTNGKTTTTTLTGEIFKRFNDNSYVVGNIGDAICNYVDQVDENGIFITEIGSFQLDGTKAFKPKGSVILNITPDHLDRHKTMENYINAKAKVFKNQDNTDFTVINIDDPILRELVDNDQVVRKYISLREDVTDGAQLKDDSLILKDNGEEIFVSKVKDIGIKGPHNLQNALAAASLAYFYGVPVEIIKEALESFKGVEHRQEFVATINGVDYINDSKGTNTDAAITALNAMEKPVILIAGGYDKKESYDNLSEKIKENTKKVILFGKTSEDIQNNLKMHGYENSTIVQSLEEATTLAHDLAEEGDVVLLSPACASWDMFQDYEQRGRKFKNLVKSYLD